MLIILQLVTLANFNWDHIFSCNKVDLAVKVFYGNLNYCINTFVPHHRCKNAKFPN